MLVRTCPGGLSKLRERSEGNLVQAGHPSLLRNVGEAMWLLLFGAQERTSRDVPSVLPCRVCMKAAFCKGLADDK